MAVTESTWTDKSGDDLTVYSNVGPDDVFLNEEWVAGSQTEKGWTLPTGKPVTVPELISEGQEPQGPTGTIVVATPVTLRVSGRTVTVTPAEYVRGYNEYGALFANSTPTGAVLWVEPDGKLRPAETS